MTKGPLSPGSLPLSALTHTEPTAVGEIDLGLPLRARLIGPAAPGCRDQLHLARLHGEPVGVVQVDRPPGSETPQDLASAIWNQAGERIADHVRRYRCAQLPVDQARLVRGIETSECPGQLPARPPGRVAVVIATAGRLDLLERLIRSMARSDHPDFEVILVDNRPSVGDTRRAVSRLAVHLPIRYVAEPRMGLAIARNTGVAAANDAEYVAFTDDDVIVDPAWLTWLVSPLAQRRVSATTGLVMPLDLSSPVQKRFELYSGFGKGVEPEVYDLQEHRADHRLLYPFWGGMFGSGNSMAFRRDMLVDLGGFDPALGAGTPTGGGEDISAFTDVILGGGQLAYQPRAVCWHEHRNDEASLRRQVYSYGVGFTATLWRYAWRDTRLLNAALRSVPLLVRLLRQRGAARSAERLPADLSRLELRGRVAGPLLYELSRRRARRMGALR